MLHLRGRCPKDIKITDVMYALKRLAVKEGKTKGKKAVVLSKNFARMVNTYGRNHETELMARYILEADLFHALKFVPQGWKLLREPAPSASAASNEEHAINSRRYSRKWTSSGRYR